MSSTPLWFARLGAHALKVFTYNKEFDRLTAEDRPDEKKAMIDKLVYEFCELARTAAGVKYEITGKENIPAAGPVVYAPNHTSIFDAPVMMVSARDIPAFVMKEELGKIPGARKWLEGIGCVFVERADALEAAVAFRQAERVVRNGSSMVIFPEGTRSKDGELHEFKGGAFKIAQLTGAPLVPVAISGAAEVFEANGHKIRPGVIKIRFLPPVSIGPMGREEFRQVVEDVKEKIGEALK